MVSIAGFKKLCSEIVANYPGCKAILCLVKRNKGITSQLNDDSSQDSLANKKVQQSAHP